MKKFYGNYLGLCIDNNDPQKRGRVQVFIPHIMPALFENWNEVGKDIKLLCVGDNLPSSLPTQMVEKLKRVLPWAEAATPIIGTCAPGNLEGGNYTQFPDAICPPGTTPIPADQVPADGLPLDPGLDATGITDLEDQQRAQLAIDNGLLGSCSQKLCARGANNILSYYVFGRGMATSGANARNMGPILQSRYNMSVVRNTGTFQNGDTFVLTSPNGAQHMETYMNGRWYSDFPQNGSLRNNYANATLYRLPRSSSSSARVASSGTTTLPVPRASQSGGRSSGGGGTLSVPGVGLVSGSGGGRVIQNQSTAAASRKGPLSQGLVQSIQTGLQGSGLDFRVFSGSQTGPGASRPRGASARHDFGRAADGDFVDSATGRILNPSANANDKQRIAQVLPRLRAAGIQGIGYDDVGYMGPSRFHLDIVSPAIWGRDRTSATQEPWVVAAVGGQTGPLVGPGEAVGGIAGANAGIICYPTSTSGQQPATNPLNSPNPLDSKATVAVPLAGNTGGSTAAGGGTLAVPGVGQISGSTGTVTKLAEDRQRYFGNEVNNPDILPRLAYLANREVGPNVDQQTAWMETVVNRAYFSGRSLTAVLNQTAYGFTPGTRQPTATTQTALNRVLGGSNITNLATDNASNAPGNPVANNRIAAGVTGAWYKDGRPVPAGTKWAEFLYRANGQPPYRTDWGINADKYATTNGLEGNPTGLPALDPTAQAAQAAQAANNGLPQQGGSIVLNPDGSGPSPVININNMAKGVFSYPAAGAVLWVFFREGNPLFPVYFAANYGESEWASAYRLPGPGQDGVGYKPASTEESPTTSVGGTLNLGTGVHQWHYVNDPNNPLNNQRSYAIGGYDGSNLAFTEGKTYLTNQFDFRQHTNGDFWSYIGGSTEEFYHGATRNINNFGDTVIRYGRTDEEAIAAAEQINTLNNQIMAPLLQSNCEESGSGAASATASAPPAGGTEAAATIGGTETPSASVIDDQGNVLDTQGNVVGYTDKAGAVTFINQNAQKLATANFGSVAGNVIEYNVLREFTPGERVGRDYVSVLTARGGVLNPGNPFAGTFSARTFGRSVIAGSFSEGYTVAGGGNSRWPRVNRFQSLSVGAAPTSFQNYLYSNRSNSPVIQGRTGATVSYVGVQGYYKTNKPNPSIAELNSPPNSFFRSSSQINYR